MRAKPAKATESTAKPVTGDAYDEAFEDVLQAEREALRPAWVTGIAAGPCIPGTNIAAFGRTVIRCRILEDHGDKILVKARGAEKPWLKPRNEVFDNQEAAEKHLQATVDREVVTMREIFRPEPPKTVPSISVFPMDFVYGKA